MSEINLQGAKPFMTKVQVMTMANLHSCQTSYDGHKRIMYIHGTNAIACINDILSNHQTAFELAGTLEKKVEESRKSHY